MDARGLTDAELMEGVYQSSMEELTNWTIEAEKVLVF
jgi:sulfur relay (sulfurtransferase) complex TusBCD TusD component (DsrE family)